jgi:porin
MRLGKATRTCGYAAVAAFLCVGGAHAEDVKAQAPIDDGSSGLTGDWGGLRHRLAEDGVILKLNWTSEIANNPQGGSQSATRYTDQWGLGATFDLDRLIGDPNAKLQLSISERSGRSLDNDVKLNTLQQTQEVWGRGQTVWLSELWYDQSFFDNLLDFRVGRMPVGSDFASFSCDFMNLTFCGSQPGNLVGSYWYNWPVSQWAGRVRVNAGQEGYVQIGAYETNPGYVKGRTYAFTLEDPPDETGALIPLEFAWTPKFGSTHLAGSYKLGVWYETETASDVVKAVNGQSVLLDSLVTGKSGSYASHSGQYGLYLNFQQALINPTPNDPTNLTVFLNTTFADPSTATTDRQIAFGAIYGGFIPFRPQDDIMIGLGTTHVNSRITDNQKAYNALVAADPTLGSPTTVQTDEYALEFDYTARLASWLTMRPNFQFINQPGGDAKAHNVMIIGLKSTMTF